MRELRDYTRLPLGAGAGLYLQQCRRFKTLRLDFVLRQRLRRFDNTRLALIGRLCERGTRKLPGMRRLNQYLDMLYGAHYEASVERLGDQQLLHLCLEVLDERYVRAPENLLAGGVDLLRQVLLDPLRQGRGFAAACLEQEKRALTRRLESLYNDKVAYAQWRCAEELGRGTAFALSHLGDGRDMGRVEGGELWDFHQHLLRHNPIELFISGPIEREQARQLALGLLEWPRDFSGPIRTQVPAVRAAPRQLFECQDIAQGKLVCGYATGLGFADGDYAVLALFDLLWGGDAQSLLFRRLREEMGLCYYVESHLEPLAGFLFATVSLDEGDFATVLRAIEAELEKVRQGRIEASDVEGAKNLLLARLAAMDDDREALMRWQLRALVAGAEVSRADFARRLRGASREDLCRLAERLELRAVYFLHGAQEAERRSA